jgi:arginine deiminase
MELNIQSEIGFLNRVIVHTPGREMSMVNPDDRESMLFDDIVYEDDAREEHLDMLKVFRAVMGPEGHIHEIIDLLNESLEWRMPPLGCLGYQVYPLRKRFVYVWRVAILN